MKIFIPGGAGFIGSVLSTEMLKKNYHVTVYDNLMFGQDSLSHLKKFKKFTFKKTDINNYSNIKSQISKSDVIIPLSALVGAPFCDKFPKLAKKTNFDFIKNLIPKLSNDQLIIFPNTNSGYGVGEKNSFCDETSPLNPVSLYGKLKVKAEEIVMQHNNSTVFRLATVFGTSYRMRLDSVSYTHLTLPTTPYV